MTSKTSIGPFTAKSDRSIRYVGNRQFAAADSADFTLTRSELEGRYQAIVRREYWSHIARINDTVFQTAASYFRESGAIFVPLPLTTRMISSPGAVYGQHRIDYTTDTVPITLKWFDSPKEVYLAESSQLYLELSLLQHDVDQVFSIYNSFRKEETDITHLSEFHHIEYEGHVSSDRNIEILEECIRRVVAALFQYNEEALRYILRPDQFASLAAIPTQRPVFFRTTLQECLAALYSDTRDDRYLDFTLQNRFGKWEETRLTQIYGQSLAVSGFPLLEVPFYHAEEPDSDPPRAKNTDLLWQGYREVAGAGERVGTQEELEAKAKLFNLPVDDYSGYLLSRREPTYRRTCGFGLGWERLVQGILCLPAIWLSTPFPRSHLGVVP
jgi:aspartyl/asparaginyl-tRNA synthetase